MSKQQLILKNKYGINDFSIISSFYKLTTNYLGSKKLNTKFAILKVIILTMRKKVLVGFIVSVAIVASVTFFLSIKSCKRINCLTLLYKQDYKLDKIYEENNYVYRALYKKDKDLLRVEVKSNLSAVDADQAVQVQITRTKGIFEDAAAPYPGEISDVISCGDQYKPTYLSKKINGIDISYFSGFVNDRLVFGSCVSDQAAYKDTLAMFYCGNQHKFYQIEIITPRQDYEKNPKNNESVLESLGCSR